MFEVVIGCGSRVLGERRWNRRFAQMQTAIRAKWANDYPAWKRGWICARPARAARARKREREETAIRPIAQSEPELKKIDRPGPEYWRAADTRNDWNYPKQQE